MIDKEKRRYYTASVHFSFETMRQANELEQVLQESRSRVVSRAIEFMYQAMVKDGSRKPE
jgi:hypothetical protein